MILPPIWGGYLAWKDSMGLRYIISHLILLIVGLGSWAFHMTLLYEMQLFDELPMLYGSCVLIYCLIGILFPKFLRSKMLIGALISYALLVTVIYLTIKKPIFHEVAYGILVFFIFVMDLQLARTKKCEVKLYIAGALMYLLGFFVWNLDNIFCSNLTNIRNNVAAPIRPFFQLHAWWHCFAGYATYLHILFCTHAGAINNKSKVAIKLDIVGLSVRKLKSTKPEGGKKRR
ncbi:Alkaline ceramidase 3 [Chamberlinius hualienensis]